MNAKSRPEPFFRPLEALESRQLLSGYGYGAPPVLAFIGSERGSFVEIFVQDHFRRVDVQTAGAGVAAGDSSPVDVGFGFAAEHSFGGAGFFHGAHPWRDGTVKPHWMDKGSSSACGQADVPPAPDIPAPPVTWTSGRGTASPAIVRPVTPADAGASQTSNDPLAPPAPHQVTRARVVSPSVQRAADALQQDSAGSSTSSSPAASPAVVQTPASLPTVFLPMQQLGSVAVAVSHDIFVAGTDGGASTAAAGVSSPAQTAGVADSSSLLKSHIAVVPETEKTASGGPWAMAPVADLSATLGARVLQAILPAQVSDAEVASAAAPVASPAPFFTFARLDATALFVDALASFTGECASLPVGPAAAPAMDAAQRLRAWAATAAVLAADAILVGVWMRKRSETKRVREIGHR